AAAGLDQVRTVLAAVGAKTGRGRLFRPSGGFSESVEVRASDAGEVDIRCYEDLVADCGMDRSPDFVKVDIEGAEADFVSSLIGLNSDRNRPLILMEFHPTKCERRGISARDVYRKTLALGYAARVLKGCGR